MNTTQPATTEPAVHQIMLVPNPTVHADPVWMTLPFWISVVGVTVSIISFWNSRAQRKATEVATYDKMRLDLFSKRFATYTAVFDLLQWYTSSHERMMSNVGIDSFKKATSDAVFLFPNDVQMYLKTLLTKLIAYHIHTKAVDHVGIANMKSAKMDEGHELIRWISEQYVNSIKVFDPHLNFRALPLSKNNLPAPLG